MLSGWRLKLSKFFIIPQRYILGLMGFFAVVNAYTMRISLSVAITEMTRPTNSSSESLDDTCSFNDTSSGSGGPIITDPDHLYDWDAETQGLILSSFYWGYVITHLPGGYLAERFGGKYTLGLGILSTGIFTLITPFVVINGDWKWLVALRVLEGLGEGTTYPALNALLAKWVPLTERAKIGTLVYAGGQIGTVVGNFVSGALIQSTKDWASVFYLFGGLGILWFVFWAFLCYSDPESHPFISDEEKNYLKKELSGVAKNHKAVPWSGILTSWPVWALVAAQIGHDWGFFTMVTDLPIYMKDVLKFNVGENGLWTSIPYIVMWIVSMLSGWLCDWLIQKNFVGVTFARKLFTSIASVGPAIFIVAASYAGCDRDAVVALFTVGMGFMGTFYCGMKVNALDLSPNNAGTLMAIVNGIGAITGIITPYLVGEITTNHTIGEWSVVFWITFVVFMVTNVIYIIWGSGEVQYWDDPDGVKGDNVEKGCEKKIEAEKGQIVQ